MDHSAQTASIPRMARKLRSSCDACGFAKTKCDRGQPQCSRCIFMNMSCVYGPSRQFGKRPRKRLDVSHTIATKNATTTAGNFVSNVEPVSDDDNTQQPHPTISSEHLLANGASYIGAETSTENNENFGPADFLPSPSSWPPLELLEHDSGAVNTTLPEQHNDLLTPPTTDQNAHRCYHQVNELLESLTVPHASTDPFANLMETSHILHINRNAIDLVGRFLKCDCAKHRADLVIVYASIITRIVLWYRRASDYATNDSSHAGSGPDDTGTPSQRAADSSTLPSLYAGECFTITEMPFSVGTFNVDEIRIQLAFRQQLIACEAKKTGPLIDKFISIGSEEAVADSNKVLYSSLGTWMKNDYVKMMNAFRDVIKATRDSMEL